MTRYTITKCHGSGNDFPLIDARDHPDADWPAVARALADRAGPVGGDGLLLLDHGRDGAAFAMRMFNADGSEAETCLNGLRCVARAGFAALGGNAATVSLKTSQAEVERADDLASGVYTVRETAGPASLDAALWPIGNHHRIVEARVPELDDLQDFTAVAMPNPHLVTFVRAVDEAALVRLGERCEAAPAWLPNRANVSQVVVEDATTLFVRTFERGVGLTDSCGSAMAASSFAAVVTGRMPRATDLVVRNRGGMVRARVEADDRVTLSGNATWEWTGEVTVVDSVASDLIVTQHYADEIAAWDRLRDGLDATI